MVHSSSPVQNNPVKTIATSTQWNKKLNDSKRFDITQIHLITTFLLNSIKVTEEFSEFFGKISISVFIPSENRLLNFKKKC